MIETAGKAQNHWPLLDFLRATAALLVLFDHTRLADFHDTDVLAQPGLFLKLFYFVTSLEGAARFPDRRKPRRFDAAGQF